MRRIAFHAINGVGLGHLVRAVTLAKEVRALVRGVEILVVTNARDTSMLRRAKLDFVSLPPRLDEPHADPERVCSSLSPAACDAALLAALDVFAPDLVVFDTHAPMPVVRELPRVGRFGARAVLVLRELRPEALRAFVGSGAPAWFDAIVVPHEPDEVDVTALAGTPVSVIGHVVRTHGQQEVAAR